MSYGTGLGGQETSSIATQLPALLRDRTSKQASSSMVVGIEDCSEFRRSLNSRLDDGPGDSATCDSDGGYYSTMPMDIIRRCPLLCRSRHGSQILQRFCT
jgi:hypothetical protein